MSEIKYINNRMYKYINGKWVDERSQIEIDPHDPDYRELHNIQIRKL
jgi:hypothetical protein|tara:strand:- start:408 stop:548 length:141 start_codon:yes stop_codon:yes gene_type:complete